MKITYLINKPQADGSIRLSIADREEWQAVVKVNKQVPLELQRYFIRDCIADGSDLDWMIIETTREEYLAWHREHTASARNRTLCQRQLKNVDFRRKGMSFFAGQYTSVYSS